MCGDRATWDDCRIAERLSFRCEPRQRAARNGASRESPDHEIASRKAICRHQWSQDERQSRRCVLVGGKGDSSGTGPHALGAHRDGRSRPGRAGQLIVGAAAVRTRAISRRTRACRFAAARTPAPGSETSHAMTGGGFRPTRGLRYRSQPSPRYARKSRFEARKNAWHATRHHAWQGQTPDPAVRQREPVLGEQE